MVFRASFLLLPFLAAIAFLLVGSLYAESITALIRRRVPHFTYRGEIFLIWGLVVLGASALVLVIVYLLTVPWILRGW